MLPCAGPLAFEREKGERASIFQQEKLKDGYRQLDAEHKVDFSVLACLCLTPKALRNKQGCRKTVLFLFNSKDFF